MALTAAVALRERSRFFAFVAAAPAILLLAHLLPASGPGLALRLAGAAACVLLLPGALLLRWLGWPSSLAVALAASFAISVAVVAFGLALVLATGASILLAAGFIMIVSACAALLAMLRGQPTPVPRAERLTVAAVLGVAVPFAGAVWWGAGPLRGDGFFHLARARKLAELDSLSGLTTVGEFRDGVLHPGYAFPLWQAVDALIARFAGLDVEDVVLYLPAILVPLAFVLAYGAGFAVFRSRAGGLALAAALVAQFGFLSRDGDVAGTGLFESLSQPQVASVVLLATTVVALAFAFVVEGGWILLTALAAATAALATVHPTYAPYVALFIGGFLVARVVLVRGWEPLLTRSTVVLGAILAPFGLLLLLLLPVVSNTRGYTPSGVERASELRHYGSGFTTLGGWFGLSPDAIARGGPVVVAGLLAVPLAGFAGRRLWAALVLGGSLAVLTVVLVPPFFTALSDAFSLSQARRLPGFLPIAFAVAGGCLVLSHLRALGVGLAAAAGLGLVLLNPTEYSYRYEEGGPGWTVWVAVGGGLVALVAGVLLRTRGPSPSFWAPAAAVAFVVPVAIVALAGLDRNGARTSLTPGLIAAVRAEAAPGDVVFSDSGSAYSIAAFAPVYINAAPIGHVADTRGNHARARVAAARRFFVRQSLTHEERSAILDRYGADWVLVDRHRPHPEEFLRKLGLAYQDARYALYEVSS